MYLCSRFPWLLAVLPALVLGVGPTDALARSMPAGFMMHEDAAKHALAAHYSSPSKVHTPAPAPTPKAHTPAPTPTPMHPKAASKSMSAEDIRLHYQAQQEKAHTAKTHQKAPTPAPRPTSLPNNRPKNHRTVWQRIAKVVGRVGSRAKSPDYVSLNINSPLPAPVRKLGARVLPAPVRKLGARVLPAPVRKILVSSGHITRDRYGRVYVGTGPSLGRPGGSLAVGWQTQLNKPSRSQLKNLLTGRSDNFGGGYWAGGGVMRSRGGWAIQAGGYSPGVSYSRQYTWPLHFRGSRR
jgi:hypothetical protein